MPIPQRVSEIVAYQQPHDSILSRLIYRRISKYLTYGLLRWIPGISAPDVTIISFIIGVIGAVALLSPSWWARLIAFVCIQLSFAFDCSDGEVARMTGRGSKFGIWFDSISDRTKEIIWFVAIGIQLYYHAPVPALADLGSGIGGIGWTDLITGRVGAWPGILYLALTAAIGMTLVGYLREAKKSIFLEKRKPEFVLKQGLHIGTVDVITFLLAFGALMHFEYYVLWIVTLPVPLLIVKQLISTYRQSNKPNRQSTTPLV